MNTIQNSVHKLLDELTPRQREVISARFGVAGAKRPQTLAAIGKRLGVTRERVRQIERGALDMLSGHIEHYPVLVRALRSARQYLAARGGVVRHDVFFLEQPRLFREADKQYVRFLIAASGMFFFHPEDGEYQAFYYLDAKSLQRARTYITEWVKALRSRKRDILRGSYEKHFAAFLKSKRIRRRHMEYYVAVSKKIHRNPFDDMGLAEWPEVNPVTVRDRVHLLLKKQGEPLHFETIAELINEKGFGGRQALAATVHNELIKDPRFVLVGRGMYALAEQGYEPGTAKEVIRRVLKKRGPMTPKNIILAIQKERLFKPNTVLVNLQDKRHFRRLDDGRYHVREA